MKGLNIILICLLVLFSISCQKQPISNSKASEELWEGGIHTLTGQIETVNLSEKGQYLTLIDNHANRKFVWVIAENLNKNSSNYRAFSIGEFITFRGNYNQDGELVAIEILETM